MILLFKVTKSRRGSRNSYEGGAEPILASSGYGPVPSNSLRVKLGAFRYSFAPPPPPLFFSKVEIG